MNSFIDLLDFKLLDEPNEIGNLDIALRSIEGWSNCSIIELRNMFDGNLRVGLVLIGFWSFDILKNPKFIDEYLIGYSGKKLGSQEQQLIKSGLLEIIRSCRIDLDEDEDAIDYHYSAVGKLYRLTKNCAEDILVSNLVESPSVQLIDSLGVLIGHEYQGFLKKETVKTLTELSHSDSDFLSMAAKRVLLEDVLRVNRYADSKSKG
jgi:hypothetical protein